MKRTIYILFSILLSACAATTTAPSEAKKAIDSATPKISTSTTTLTATIQPSSTPILLTLTKLSQRNPEFFLTEQSYQARSTKVGEFSVNCHNFGIDKDSISPNGNWVAISCGDKRDETLEVVNRENKHWVLQFKNYLLKEYINNNGDTPTGSLFPSHWSHDEKYLYFTSHLRFYGGGPCFYGYRVQSLYRMKLSDGMVSTTLPAGETVRYDFAFSPSDRRLAYQSSGDLVIIDLQTGNELKINTGKNSVGTLTWSPDGLELAYVTCEAIKDGNDYSIKKSAVKIFSVQKQTSRTILEREKIMLFIRNWNSTNIMEIVQSQYGNYQAVEQLMGKGSQRCERDRAGSVVCEAVVD
jgi:hypothetical protein